VNIARESISDRPRAGPQPRPTCGASVDVRVLDTTQDQLNQLIEWPPFLVPRRCVAATSVVGAV
jgi:hypothetical protein